MKKNRFLIIALGISIILHLLVFIFAPELKSEINSNDYLKKITRISIFRDEPKPVTPKAEIKPEITKKRASTRNVEISEPRNIDEKVGAENRNVEISESQNIDEKSGAPSRNLKISESQNIDEKSGAPSRNLEISESRNIDGTTGRRNDNNSAPKTAGELAVIPKALNPKTPDYPESLEDEGIEGSVTLELLISKEGKVLKAKVIKSDHELFSESALKAVKNYKFSPGKLADGSAADSLIEFVVKFEISL